MNARYKIDDTRSIVTPALIVFREVLEENLREMVAVARDSSRLRPHCKTHKMPQVIRMQAEFGISKHKAATVAECEMLAMAGVQDVMMAYPVVGANIPRVVQFVATYPDVALSVIADDSESIARLGAAMTEAKQTVAVLLDIDVGQHRTGVTLGPDAMDRYREICNTSGLITGGLHVYDGHQHQQTREERRQAVLVEWIRVLEFRDSLRTAGLPVPKIVAGGTATFPIYAEFDDPTVEFSPGTCVFHDASYADKFPDLAFTPAALLLTRVISRPASDLLTVDLGYKAIASDPPKGRRAVFPDLPDAEEALHSEEHMVLRTRLADKFRPGDELLAIPRHVCPTSALHKEAYVVANRQVTETWTVTARDRVLRI